MNSYNSTHIYETSESRGPMAKAIGKNIKDFRNKKRLTQEVVAALAGINEKYLGELERGIKSPSAVVLQKIAGALEVPLCSILSANGCPCADGNLPAELARLFMGKEARRIKKAVRILEAYFE